MKPCQLCGAKSWGEVPASIDLHRDAEMFLIGKDLSQYRRCDGCGAFASLVQMALEDPPRRDPVEESLALPGIVGPAVAAFTSMMPKPETRLERLVRAMLQSGTVHRDFIGPRDVVGYAQVIESELDTPAGAEDPVEGSLVWHAHEWNFKDRDALLQWLIAGLDAGREYLNRQEVVCTVNINRLAAALILWMEGGGPRES